MHRIGGRTAKFAGADANQEQRMSTRSLARMSLAVLAGFAAAASAAAPSHAAGMKAKISMSEARQIALNAYPGKVMKEELERERGGSGLRYSFDIRKGKRWREIGVDAITGKVLENIAEGANPKD
jgi:uncharacterized membrane protein YkoI